MLPFIFLKFSYGRLIRIVYEYIPRNLSLCPISKKLHNLGGYRLELVVYLNQHCCILLHPGSDKVAFPRDALEYKSDSIGTLLRIGCIYPHENISNLSKSFLSAILFLSQSMDLTLFFLLKFGNINPVALPLRPCILFLYSLVPLGTLVIICFSFFLP